MGENVARNVHMGKGVRVWGPLVHGVTFLLSPLQIFNINNFITYYFIYPPPPHKPSWIRDEQELFVEKLYFVD